MYKYKCLSCYNQFNSKPEGEIRYYNKIFISFLCACPYCGNNQFFYTKFGERLDKLKKLKDV